MRKGINKSDSMSETKRNVWVTMAKKKQWVLVARELVCVFMPSWLIRV